MVRRETQRLADILEAIGDLNDFTKGMTSKSFAGDRQVQLAVAGTLVIIGEAVKALPDDLRDRHPSVNWRQWSGLRDVLVHQYFRVELPRVWRIIKRDLPALERAARAEFERATSND